MTDDDELRQQLARAHQRIASLQRENARLLEQVAEGRKLANAARVASIAILEALDLQEILDTLLDCIAPLVPFDTGCVLLLTDDGRVAMMAGVGFDQPFEPGAISFGVAQRPHLDACVRDMRSVVIEDTREAPGWRRGVAVSEETRSWLGVPLVARGRVLGLFGLDKREPGFFTAAHVRLAEDLAGHAALAIANVQRDAPTPTSSASSDPDATT